MVFAAWPFLSLLLGSKVRDLVFREVCYRVLVDQLVEGCSGDTCFASAVFAYASKEIKVPGERGVPKDQSPLGVIAHGHGWCDQQAHAMITLASLGDIPGNLLFLYGYDSISHHAVCELEVGGTMLLYDPYYQATFRTQDGAQAGLNDLLAGDHDTLPMTGQVPPGYFRLFEEAYTARLHLSNRPPDWKRWLRWWTKQYCRAPTKHLLSAYTALYKAADDQRSLDMDGIDRIMSPQ